MRLLFEVQWLARYCMESDGQATEGLPKQNGLKDAMWLFDVYAWQVCLKWK